MTRCGLCSLDGMLSRCVCVCLDKESVSFAHYFGSNYWFQRKTAVTSQFSLPRSKFKCIQIAHDFITPRQCQRQCIFHNLVVISFISSFLNRLRDDNWFFFSVNICLRCEIIIYELSSFFFSLALYVIMHFFGLNQKLPECKWFLLKNYFPFQIVFFLLATDKVNEWEK